MTNQRQIVRERVAVARARTLTMKSHDNINKPISTVGLSLLNIFGGLIFGYNTGVIAGVLQVDEWKSMSQIDLGFLTCSILLGAMIGSLAAGIITERLGRRRPLFVVGILTLIGAIGSSLVPTNLWYVSAFRLVLGLGVGASAIICPLYVGEMAPPEKKGQLGTLFQIAITVGILIGDIIGFGFLHVQYNYRWMFGFGALPGILLFGLLFSIPESTVWREKKSAMKNTQLLLNKDPTNDVGIGALLSRKDGRFALFMGCILAINNQLTGINAFMYFSPKIFEKAGISSNNGQMIATISLVAWNAITTFISTLFVDRLGRRKLTLYSSIVMTVSCLLLALMFLLFNGTTLGVLSIILLFVFIAGFESGVGPLFWIMAIEIFPPECKDVGSSLLNALQWIFNIALSFSFLSLVTLIGQSAIFWIFGGIGVVCLIVMYFLLPETNHKDYQEIKNT
ncbi:hypothetical protein SAMD00019534_071890 [Acytostelium subglobosum LB1]|uniref:hypothetical protein n=1 Tax=Acytostelium subglobosum LB1 TaxID=1410327 RepID=UPI000644FFB1|nr:hypothetical protein SAMD00019534_071890 [Acytostelium subglobosum LB1]GAM24014.1 hypothetical protein SAMD00019534_071890 [Acytostelium subglobosum LB1]|eukprot:XP_012753050.1 hypothetical protein SAMD00019534_071890 [Acytostelium subglobosum LB1]